MKKSAENDRTSRAPSDIDRAVGHNTRRLRLDRGLALAELSETLGISHQQLQKYETGTNRVSAGMLSNLATTLCVSFEELFHVEGGKIHARATIREGRREALRKQCRDLVARVDSIEKLEEMARVLRALSA